MGSVSRGVDRVPGAPMNLYSEIDPYAAEWLRNLIADGAIAPGLVHGDIHDIDADTIRSATQYHAFAGIGGWPLALDLAGLYEQLLRQLMTLPPRAGESLKAQVERLGQVRSKQNECLKMESHLQKEQQFNRKVEANSQLRALRKELEELSR